VANNLDTLARLSIHTLQRPSPSFAPLCRPLLTPGSVPETLLVILLDWAEPWQWVRQLRDWIRLLQEVTSTLDEETKTVMQENLHEWEQRRRGGAFEGGGAVNASETNVNIPLGPGEWDEALGLPLCVVCHNVRRSPTHTLLLLITGRPTRLICWRMNMVGARRSLTTYCSFSGLFC
jgi:dynein light intermediate chain 1